MRNQKQRDYIRDVRINNSMRYSSNRLPRPFRIIDHLQSVNSYNELGDANNYEKAQSAFKNNFLIGLTVMFEMMVVSLRFLAMAMTGKRK